MHNLDGSTDKLMYGTNGQIACVTDILTPFVRGQDGGHLVHNDFHVFLLERKYIMPILKQDII